MRLTLINQFYKPDISPTARLAASLAEHRAALGDQVTVVASRGGYVQRGEADDSDGNPRVRRVWTPQLGKHSGIRRLLDWGIFYVLAFVRVITLPRQDVIISLTTPPYIALAAVIHKMFHPRTRVILWNMDCYPDVVERTGHIRKGGLVSKFLRMMNRILFRRLDYLVSLDEAMSDLLIHQYGPTQRTLPHRVIPNWEPLAEFPLTEHRKTLNTFTVLYMGNAGYGHDFETILDVADQLRDEPFSFVFVGGGSRRAYIDEQRQWRNLPNVTLGVYVPEEQKQSMLATADCALITLADFALGIMSPSKVHANLAMGTPVLYIGPAGSNVDEIVRRFGCGGSFRKGDVQGVVTFLRQLRTEPQLDRRLRESARRAFNDAYCDEKALPLWDEVLSV